jgi:glutamate-1-semialdehyde 2,1-aminomutase
MAGEEMRLSKSQKLYELAKKLMPGGVNSPVRAYEPYPFFTSHAEGPIICDVDGNRYIDYCMAYGPLILGHAHRQVIKAVRQSLSKGTIYGTPTEAEVRLAEMAMKAFPSIEMIRLVNTGTEATMHAIRVARGYTGRKKIVKFEGGYHGAHDYVLVKAGSGATTFGTPTSLGIPEETSKNTFVLPFNNTALLQQFIDRYGEEIAAVVIEPVMGNAGPILPREGYLQDVRKITQEHGVILIFDEVITGFRLAFGGAQEYFKITPDMTTLGKILGGGLPLAAFGGKKEVMEQVSPLGRVYQAGTFNGNPISVAAGLETLKILSKKPEIYEQLKRKGDRLRKSLQDIIEDRRVAVQVSGLESMFQIFFTKNAVTDYESVQTSDRTQFMNYQRNLMKQRVFVPPSQFETCFISAVHTDTQVSKSLEAMDSAISLL